MKRNSGQTWYGGEEGELARWERRLSDGCFSQVPRMSVGKQNKMKSRRNAITLPDDGGIRIAWCLLRVLKTSIKIQRLRKMGGNVNQEKVKSKSSAEKNWHGQFNFSFRNDAFFHTWGKESVENLMLFLVAFPRPASVVLYSYYCFY